MFHIRSLLATVLWSHFYAPAQGYDCPVVSELWHYEYIYSFTRGQNRRRKIDVCIPLYPLIIVFEYSPAGITSFALNCLVAEYGLYDFFTHSIVPSILLWSLMHPRLLGGTLMVALGIAYMIFGNAIVDPYSKPITVDKQDWVSKTILAIQVSLYYITSHVTSLTDSLLDWIDHIVYDCYPVEHTVITSQTRACFG